MRSTGTTWLHRNLVRIFIEGLITTVPSTTATVSNHADDHRSWLTAVQSTNTIGLLYTNGAKLVVTNV